VLGCNVTVLPVPAGLGGQVGAVRALGGRGAGAGPFGPGDVRGVMAMETEARPQCQQRSPLGLTRPPGGPTDDHAIAL
jgi:hypothetical protein